MRPSCHLLCCNTARLAAQQPPSSCESMNSLLQQCWCGAQGALFFYELVFYRMVTLKDLLHAISNDKGLAALNKLSPMLRALFYILHTFLADPAAVRARPQGPYLTNLDHEAMVVGLASCYMRDTHMLPLTQVRSEHARSSLMMAPSSDSHAGYHHLGPQQGGMHAHGLVQQDETRIRVDDSALAGWSSHCAEVHHASNAQAFLSHASVPKAAWRMQQRSPMPATPEQLKL